MKKALLLGVLALSLSASYINAQTEEPIVEITTSIVPEDQKPIGFESTTEQEKMVPMQIAECKSRILKFKDDAKKVKYYREMIWRLENSYVNELSGSSN